MSYFTTITVSNSAGVPIAGAAVKVLSPTGVDVTANVLGVATAFTNAQGIVQYYGNGTVTPAAYVISVAAPGYAPTSLTTAPTFTGNGLFTFVLVNAATGGLTLVSEPPLYVSAMQPVLVGLTATPQLGWQVVVCTVTDQRSGAATTIECPVSASGEVVFNLQSRFTMPTVHKLLPGPAANDPGLMRTYEVTFAVLTDAGTVPSNISLTVHAINLQPRGKVNDLTAMVGKWFTLWPEVPVWSGHYVDLLALLGEEMPTANLAVRVTYQDRAKQPTSTATFALEDVGTGLVRVRTQPPVNGAVYATYEIVSGATPLTNTILTRYV